MTVHSKFFNENIRHRCCTNDLLHPHGCWSNFFINSYGFLVSNMKYFLPLTLVSMLLKLRKLNKDEVKKLGMNYMHMCLTGYSIGLSISVFMCLLRHLLGEFTENTLVLVPSIMGSLFTYCSSWRVQDLFMTTTFQSTVETVLLQKRNCVASTLMNSQCLQTLVFMICSGLILHAKRKEMYKGFWLMRPDATRASNEVSANPTASCVHANCKTHFWHGIRSHLAIGFTLDVIGMLRSKVATPLPKGLAPMMIAKLRNFQFKSAALLAASVGIYRLTFCTLNRHMPAMSADHRHWIACFLSGSSYRLYPKVTLLSYGIVISAYVLHSHFMAATIPDEWAALNYLKMVPYSRILYPISLGILIDWYIRDQKSVPPLGTSLINGVTNNLAKRIACNIDKLN